jgi:predicted Zn-ribbon and HTH transcriptional regulator
MFRLELHQLLFAYTGTCLAIVVLAWSLHSARRSKRESLALRSLAKCGICSFEFRDDTKNVIPPCPRCGARVSRGRLSHL